jgi:hypothetical protein
MNLVIKGVASVNVDITDSGKICIEQYDETFGELVFVYLTLEQLRIIGKWVDKNYLDIANAWNDGIEVTDDSKA